MTKSICEDLGITKEEEYFMSHYNPLQYYCRAKDIGIDTSGLRFRVYIRIYDSLYKKILGLRDKDGTNKKKFYGDTDIAY